MNEEPRHETTAARSSSDAARQSERAKQMPAYLSAPDVMPSVPLLSPNDAHASEEEETTSAAPSVEEQKDERAEGVRDVEPLPSVEGRGEEEEVEVEGKSLRLKGKTKASFSHSFRTVDVVTEPGEGCKKCKGRACVHVTGTIESTFNVSTKVTLPSVPKGLTECQRERVRDAIDNVLAPHEDEHVAAYNDYAGTLSTPFDMTICAKSFNAKITAMHNAEEKSRRAAAKAASAALDPFFFDVDLDCEEEEETSTLEPENMDAGAGVPEEVA